MIIFGTGHRPNKLGGYGEDTADSLRDMAKMFLSCIGPKHVISGVALGWDIAIARAATDLCIPWTAALPFSGQESQWPLASRQEYKHLLRRASRVVIVSKGGYSPSKMQIRNQWMADNGTVCVALWDGSEGGTANCLQYVRRKGQRIINLWPAWVRHPNNRERTIGEILL